jgi:CP family cyanate transporter-like MFS transporter
VLAWRITSFSAIAFLLFFSILAWYAPIYQAQGWSDAAAGSLLAVLLTTQLISATVVAAAARRQTGRRLLITLGILLSVTGLMGAAFMPLAAPWIWAASTGLGLGVLFTLTLTLPVDFGAIRKMSAGSRRWP